VDGAHDNLGAVDGALNVERRRRYVPLDDLDERVGGCAPCARRVSTRHGAPRATSPLHEQRAQSPLPPATRNQQTGSGRRARPRDLRRAPRG
jgi:hypothetical protein